MKSRLDRYKEDNCERKTSSRLSKNKHLYDDLNNKIGFEELVDFNTQTRIELTSLNEPKRNRESYQQLKDYQSLISSKKEQEPERVDEEEIKVFDINSVLEEARKNRHEVDDLEKKRKLKKEEYNILSDLNKKYLSNNENKKAKDEYEGLEELINTITSKTLAQDIKAEEEKDLFSDLVATSVDLQVKAPSENEKIDITGLIDTIKNDDEDEEIYKTGKVENSFYTRSMDLSEHDFDFDEETERKASVKHGILITVVIILLLIIIAIVGYFVLQNYGIDLFKLLKNFGK
jgi:hypothetical protein